MNFRIILIILSVFSLSIGIFITKTSLEESYTLSILRIREIVIMNNNGLYDDNQFKYELQKEAMNLNSIRSKLSIFGNKKEDIDLKLMNDAKNNIYLINNDKINPILRNREHILNFLEKNGSLTNQEYIFYGSFIGNPTFDKTLYVRLRQFIEKPTN